MDPTSQYVIPERTLTYFRSRVVKGRRERQSWDLLLHKYFEKHPILSSSLQSRLSGNIGTFEDLLESVDSTQFDGMATRESNGIVLQKLWNILPGMIGGGADLITSNKFLYNESDIFDTLKSPEGRYIRHGIREHAMVGTANGIAAFAPNVFVPITSTFLIFFIYVSIM